VFFRDITREHKRGKATGQHGVEILSGKFPEQRVVAREELTTSAFDTRSPYTFEFPSTDTGTYLYLCLRWENSRGEKGPWSKIHRVTIP
jgi:hypothetical protein